MAVQRTRCGPPAQHTITFGFNAYTTPETVAKQVDVGATASRLFVTW
jgi:hypothetical protein